MLSRNSAGRVTIRLPKQFGCTEIRQLRVSAPGHQDIFGLDVPMEDAGFVRACQPVGYAGQKFYDLTPASLLGASPVSERATINQLGNQILAAIKLSGIVDGKNVGMVQRGCHLGLALEATACACIR
jgi:hypothetical protein